MRDTPAIGAVACLNEADTAQSCWHADDLIASWHAAHRHQGVQVLGTFSASTAREPLHDHRFGRMSRGHRGYRFRNGDHGCAWQVHCTDPNTCAVGGLEIGSLSQAMVAVGGAVAFHRQRPQGQIVVSSDDLVGRGGYGPVMRMGVYVATHRAPTPDSRWPVPATRRLVISSAG